MSSVFFVFSDLFFVQHFSPPSFHAVRLNLVFFFSQCWHANSQTGCRRQGRKYNFKFQRHETYKKMKNAKNKKKTKNNKKLIVANLAQQFPKSCHLGKEDSAEPRNSVASQMDPATTHDLQAGQRGYLKNSHGSCQLRHATMVKPTAFGHRARELNFLVTMKSRH